MKVERALISVSDKKGVVDLARGLVDLGVEILSTGGTARTLREAGLPVRDVADYTGFPEMMDGRVKTLHPKVHGGILALRDAPDHLKAMGEHGILPIDMVVVNLYPFRETAAKGLSREETIEQIDIGGPTMVRSAAKNHRFVVVLTDPEDYNGVLTEMRATKGEVGEATRRRLALAAFRHTAAYDAAIAAWLAGQEEEPGFPSTFAVVGDKAADLRYGENPHQGAALYRLLEKEGPSVAGARQIHGKELSFNNYLDLDAAFALAAEFSRPAAVVVKHTNPCGCALGETPAEAFLGALEGDPLSAFGSVTALNRPVDAAAAGAMAGEGTFLEAVIAPSFTPEALEILKGAKWGRNVRLMEVPSWGYPGGSLEVRPISGGFLLQERDLPGRADPDFRCVTSRNPSGEEREDLMFAWHVVKHVRSNAIVLARGRRVVGVGAGQMSRVDAVELAVKKAGGRARDAVLASDAFFPFPDGIEAAARAGVTAAIEPGGSRRDQDVVAAAEKAGMSLIFTGVRHFRH